ncbi:TAP-like protein-domain-containing protein [Mycena latifolia]|nr:TAP-like protein-domain-containing protein [Mycena latifolia]
MNTNFRKSLAVLFGGVALSALTGLFLVSKRTPLAYFKASASHSDAPGFSWAHIIPSNELKWVDCYWEAQCARLNAPLNYSEPNGEKAVIAMARYPAAVPAGSPLYRGPVFFSGAAIGMDVLSVAFAGSALARIIGPEFDIIGFDVRGMAHSTPRVSLFKTEVERAIWHQTIPLPQELNASADAVARAWARAQVNGRLAAERAGDYLAHINTDNTARDMLRIVEALGVEKLQYWGMSYGTVLGAVFATLFPDKVGRMVLDGVLDAEDYFDKLRSHNFVNTDRALQSFFDACVAAGPKHWWSPKGCAFYAPTPEAISQNLTALYESIRVRPIPVYTPSGGYGLVDFALLRLVVFLNLYRGQESFNSLGDVLAALARGDGAATPLQWMLEPVPKCSCDAHEDLSDIVLDGVLAIICNDGRAVSSDFDEIEQYYANMTKASGWGSIMASVRIACSGWPAGPKKHFQGPVGGNTSIPMLIIGNTADPITPWAAKKTAKAFPGSIVLTQDCAGHGSLAASSPCTWGHIREYFGSGALPDAGTVCPVVGSPFADASLQPQAQTVLSVTERSVFDALTAMQRNSWRRKFIL